MVNMKLLVFGATGGTGRALLNQGLEQGHQVTAFVRNPAALEPRPGLTVVPGDVTDAAAVGCAVAGQEAILSALGPRGGGYGVLPGGVRNIVAAMNQAGVRRLIHVSSFGVGDSLAQMGWVARGIVVPLFLRKALDEKEIEEGIIRASDLDWIIARPGGLEDEPRTGVYRCITDPHEKVGQPRIARADVADFMLQNLVDERFVRRAVGLTY
jgi:putative NADH-flavin reductase